MFSMTTVGNHAPRQRGINRIVATAVLLFVHMTAPLAVRAQSPGDVAKVESALPTAARAAPLTSRKLLIFTLCKGFVHSSIPLGAKTLDLMGQKTGAYAATVSDDPGVFAPERLSVFDAVCMLNTTGELFDDKALKQSLLDFVKNGKGLIGIHAATDCFYKWSDYGEMMGGYFDGHPWGSGETVTCKLDDPAHPLNAAFKGRGFTITDEIYQFQRQPYSRDKLRVLVSLDTAKTNMDKGGLKRADNDYAVSWVRAYGKGRVFYCSLGHNESTYWDPAVLRHYLDGIQFALGDLQADTTPSAALTPEQIQQSNADGAQLLLNEAFKDLAQYRIGQDPSAPKLVSELVLAAHDDEAKRVDLEKRLVALLEGGPTPEARQFAVKHLYLIGTERSLPILSMMLANPDTCDDARYALERLPGVGVDVVLRDALRTASGPALTGIVNSLGERRDPEAVPLIAQLLQSDDPVVATAAALAIGKIGGDDAEKVLETALWTATPQRAKPFLDALLTAAETRVARGDRERASAIYGELARSGNTVRARCAGLQGLATTNSAEATKAVLAALSDPDPKLQQAAAAAARSIAGPEATQAFASSLNTLSQPSQVLLIESLADRGDPAALAAVTGAVSNTDPLISLTAVRALGKLGDASSVGQLANLAGKTQGDLQATARSSLANLRGADVDNAIADLVERSDPPVRAELVRALASRMAKTSMPTLLSVAHDADESVRIQAYAALGALAGPDQLRPLVEQLAVEQSEVARAEGEKAALAVLGRCSDPAFAAAVVLSALPDVRQGIPAYCSILRVLGSINDPAALEALLSAAKLKNGEVRMTAARALAEWPTSAPMADLLSLAQSAEEVPFRDVVLRGYLRMIAMSDNEGALREQYAAAFAASRSPEERKLVLASIGKQHDPKLIELVTPLLEDADVKQEAAFAVEQMKKTSLVLDASRGNGDLNKAIDGDPTTRWSTNEPQKSDQWFKIDLGYVAEVNKIVLDTTASPGDYPREYSVFISKNGKTWDGPVLKGKGNDPVTELNLNAAKTRFIKIEQTGHDDGLFWSIHELKVELK